MYIYIVYLYGNAAKLDTRRTIPQIRDGEYEQLQSKVSTIAFDHIFSLLLGFVLSHHM